MPTLAPTTPSRRTPGLAPVKLRPSRHLQRLYRALVLLLAALPLAAFLSSGTDRFPIALWLLPFWGVLLASLWREHRRWREHPTALSYESDDWILHWGSKRLTVVAKGEWVLWSWLQVLRFRDDHSGRCWALVCLPDSAEAEDRRRLRVWLKIGSWR